MGYSHIVFDVDGTLIDTFYSNMRSLQEVLKDLTGQVRSMEDLGQYFGITGLDAALQLGFADPHAALRQWEETLCKYTDHNKLYDGIEALLDRLTRAGCGLGVATSRTRAEVEADPILRSVEHYFQFIITADDTPRHKPHPDPLLRYMALAGCAPEQVLFVGDSAYDMQCAAAAGAASGLALWGAQEPQACTHLLQRPEDVDALVLAATH